MTQEWGLAGFGRSGELELHLDEPQSDDAAWHLVIDLPRVWLRIEIDGPQVIQELIKFVEATIAKPALVRREICFGRCCGASCRLVKDDESADRYYFSTEDGSLFLDVVEEWPVRLLKALRQVAADIAE
jgi:hypothetical protein